MQKVFCLRRAFNGLRAIFFFFAIQNIYVNSNHEEFFFYKKLVLFIYNISITL